ncbi:MAG: UDP-2,3-diacylglucosamine diphosphatase [Phycisphaeraceae bacterium]|nr:UDP-2,3-diacylglucosamine diphosphatase [Phycisphaeraceae bacterium]
MRTRFRTIFISDTHLGTGSARADDLAFFLKRVTCDRLYLVGDIIDMWWLRQRWKWPASHTTVLRRLLKLSSKGVEIIYLPGNHDDAARPYAGMEFGGIRVELAAQHECADGRRLLVCHGDHYDLVVRTRPWLGMLGSAGYEVLLRANRLWNAGRRMFGLPYHSLAQAVKLRVKRACMYVSHYEEELRREAERGGCDGVVCGHIHKAELRVDQGLTYANCGDWVESCTALVEHEDGRLELLDGLAFNESWRRLEESGAVPTEDPDPWIDPPLPFPLPHVEPSKAHRAASSC